VTTMETKPKDEKDQEPVVFEKVTVHGGAAGGGTRGAIVNLRIEGKADTVESVRVLAEAAPKLLLRLQSLVFHGEGNLPEVELRLAREAIAEAERR